MSEDKKIILVEDDPAIVDIYKILIKKAGYEVQSITSGQDMLRKIKAIEKGEDPKPDLILLDLILPDINGIELLHELKKQASTKDIRVFIMSNQENTTIEEFGDAKPDKFIVKANITPTDLLATIKEELG